MCEPKPSNRGLMVGSAVVAGVLLFAGVNAATPPKPAPVKAPAVEHAGTPWLGYLAVALVAVVVTLAVVLVVRLARRHRTVVRPVEQRPAPRALPRRDQPAIEAPPIKASAFMRGEVDAR